MGGDLNVYLGILSDVGRSSRGNIYSLKVLFYCMYVQF